MKTIYTKEPIDPDKNYLVCKRIEGNWHVVASHKHYELAEISRDTRANNDLIEGLISDPLFYRIYYKNTVNIQELI